VSDRPLPEAIAGHLRHVLTEGADTPDRILLGQTGEMLRKPGDGPLQFAAAQELSVHKVEFEWRAAFGPNRLVRMAVIDRYRDGQGLLTAKVWGLVPVVRRRGPETDRGEAMRYLAELPWVPHAIGSNAQLSWRELEDGSVEVSTLVGGRAATVQLSFDEAGLIATAAGVRPRLSAGTTVDTPFVGRFGDYVERGGIRIPRTAEVSWELPDGPFTYWRGEVTSLVAE
jgi:hypothetical protein